MPESRRKMKIWYDPEFLIVLMLFNTIELLAKRQVKTKSPIVSSKQIQVNGICRRGPNVPFVSGTTSLSCAGFSALLSSDVSALSYRRVIINAATKK
jgi:hypothetical protein